MSGLIRIRIVGCGRILPAHLRGFHLLHECGIDGILQTFGDKASPGKRGQPAGYVQLDQRVPEGR